MTIIESNRDALLVAIPMIGLLFVGFFRLDELFGKSKKPVKSRRPIAADDQNGRPICLDPDGQVVGPKSRKN
jgi:hypothetical protein